MSETFPVENQVNIFRALVTDLQTESLSKRQAETENAEPVIDVPEQETEPKEEVEEIKE